MYIPNPVPEGHTETLQLTVIPQFYYLCLFISGQEMKFFLTKGNCINAKFSRKKIDNSVFCQLFFCQVCILSTVILSPFILSSTYFVNCYFVNCYFVNCFFVNFYFVNCYFVKYIFCQLLFCQLYFVNYVLSTLILSNPDDLLRYLQNMRLSCALLHKSSSPRQQNGFHVVLHIFQIQLFQPEMVQ